MNNTNLRYTVLHISVTQQVKVDYVNAAIQRNDAGDNSDNMWIMQQLFHQVCSVGNF